MTQLKLLDNYIESIDTTKKCMEHSSNFIKTIYRLLSNKYTYDLCDLIDITESYTCIDLSLQTSRGKGKDLLERILDASFNISLDDFLNIVEQIKLTIIKNYNSPEYWMSNRNHVIYECKERQIGIYDAFYIICFMEVLGYRDYLYLIGGFINASSASYPENCEHNNYYIADMSDDQITFAKKTIKAASKVSNIYSWINTTTQMLITICEEVDKHNEQVNKTYLMTQRLTLELYSDFREVYDKTETLKSKLETIINVYDNIPWPNYKELD